MNTQLSIFPPTTLGILGGGQLGMMLGRVAKQFGYKVIVFEPDAMAPARHIADMHIAQDYTNHAALIEFAHKCDVITTEFENIPADVVELLTELTQVYPKANALRIAQNRIKEKQFFNSLGLSTAKFLPINTLEDIANVDNTIFPAILKTATLGYDGKGQIKVNNHTELVEAFVKLNKVPCVLEKIIELKQELSIIVARNKYGVEVYPLIENYHRNGILDISYFPAQAEPSIVDAAYQAAVKIVNGLDYVGLLTIEFFISIDNQLLVNEIAPRPHNSGHVTIEAAVTSQFEQQLRAVCGLQLGDTTPIKAGAMLNLLGDVWLDNDNPEVVLLNHNPQAKYHNYGKQQAKLSRKMGHITILDANRQNLTVAINQLKEKLKIG